MKSGIGCLGAAGGSWRVGGGSGFDSRLTDGDGATVFDTCCELVRGFLHSVSCEDRSPGVDLHLPEDCIFQLRKRTEHDGERDLETQRVVPVI
jgi:hypothetical protein